MPVNEFEKQVKQIMKGLKISPSEPSWENIEWQLRKKREKRRLIIIWFLFLSLFLGGGLWMIVGTDRGKSIAKIEKDEAATKIEQPGPSDFKAIEKKEQTKSQIITSNQEKTKINFLKEKNASVVKPSVTKNKEPNASNAKNTTAQKKNQALIDENRTAEKWEPADKMINDSITSTAKNNIEERKQDSLVAQTDLTKQNDSKTDSAIEKNQAIIKTDVEDAAKKKIKSNKWQEVMIAEIGWSNYAEGIGGAKSLAYGTNPSSSTGSPFGMPLNAPNPATKGLSFAIGLGLSKAISGRFNFNIGLQYHYYSSHTKTGNKVEKDTMINNGADVIPVSGYYKNGTQNKYTNQFHVIEIPVSVDYRLFRNFPLDIGAGISCGHLINTNALAYNYQKNIYYKDPQSYTKNYFNIFSSLQYNWLQKNKLEIQSGPVILYNFSSLQRESNSTHLVSFGITSHIKF